ncbi:MAG TPA: hypothetical protein VFY49_07060 [Myxococcota bacterium]|nr:hypothetical protein [Myxococcota bacterium]
MTSTAGPPQPKTIALFAVQAFLLALLIGWWPTPRALYPPLLRAQAEPLLAAATHDSLTLRPAEPTLEGADTVMEAREAGLPKPRWRAELSFLRLGWWPTAVLAALVLATPMSGRRRALALLAGVLWINAYVLMRLFAEVAYADYEALRPGAESVGVAHALLRSGAEILEANVVLVAVVLLAWVALARPAQGLDTRSLRRLLPARAG